MTSCRNPFLFRLFAGLLYAVALGCVAFAVYELSGKLRHQFVIWLVSGVIAVLSAFAATTLLSCTLSRMKAKNLVRIFVCLMALGYLMVMVFLLFMRRKAVPFTLEELSALDFRAYLKGDMGNLVPFATLHRYLSAAKRGYIVRIALGNLLGNVVLFMPLGILLPLLSCWTGKPFIAIPLLLLIPALCEVLQFLLRCGVCDVDDWLFNAVGGLLAYAIMWLPFIRKPLTAHFWWPSDEG